MHGTAVTQMVQYDRHSQRCKVGQRAMAQLLLCHATHEHAHVPNLGHERLGIATVHTVQAETNDIVETLLVAQVGEHDADAQVFSRRCPALHSHEAPMRRRCFGGIELGFHEVA